MDGLKFSFPGPHEFCAVWWSRNRELTAKGCEEYLGAVESFCIMIVMVV